MANNDAIQRRLPLGKSKDLSGVSASIQSQPVLALNSTTKDASPRMLVVFVVCRLVSH